MPRPRIHRDERAAAVGGHEQFVVGDRRPTLGPARQRRPLILPHDIAAARIDGIDAIEL